MLVRHVFGLFGRLTDVSVGCFFSSFNWKCSHLLQPNVYGKNKWRKKRRGKYFWSVVAGLLSVFTILCGIFVRIGWRWELFGQSCCFAAPKIMKPLNISGSTDREEANQCQWVWLLKEYWPLVENCNKWLIQYQRNGTQKKKKKEKMIEWRAKGSLHKYLLITTGWEHSYKQINT